MAAAPLGEARCPLCGGAARVSLSKNGLAVMTMNCCNAQLFARSAKSDELVRDCIGKPTGAKPAPEPVRTEKAPEPVRTAPPAPVVTAPAPAAPVPPPPPAPARRSGFMLSI